MQNDEAFLNLCRKIIRLDSTPTSGNEEVALYCRDICREAGLEVNLQEGKLNGSKQYNVIARPQGSNKKGEIVFQTHLDTVEPGPMGNWTETDNNPFKATIKDDRIFGLGVADVKLDFLCKLRALQKFANTKQRHPFVLVGTFGEEVGMHGSELLLKEKAVDAHMAIIGEPSELKIVYANNGYLVVDFEIPYSDFERKYKAELAGKEFSTQEKVFHGKAVHSSTPHLGDNAIHKLIDYLTKLPEGVAVINAKGGSSVNTVPADAFVEIDANATFSEMDSRESVGNKLVRLAREIQKLDREFLNFEDVVFSPSHPTLNIGMLDTREDYLWLSVSIRVTPNISHDQLTAWLDRLKKIAELSGSKFKPQRISPAALTSLSSELVVGAQEILKSMRQPSEPITKASGTECSVYRKYGVDCIVFGPGVSIGNSHTANEFNFLSQLETASLFYGRCVTRFCI
jgi:acetylornithine deacetylase/succinyl-diaminopimelate desuccinylase-like protein